MSDKEWVFPFDFLKNFKGEYMINERRAKLMETVKGFNKLKKSSVFTMGNEIVDAPVIPTGIEVVDKAIGGGVKRSGHTIIYGPYSIGKTALVMHLIANAQKENLNVCYVNTEKPISPDRFRFFGINLDDLLYIEAPENAELALEALRTLAKDKVIDLFIIDSTNGLCPLSVQSKVKDGEETQERGLDKKNVAALPMTLSNFYNVVNAQIFRAKAAVVWLGQLRTKGIGGYVVMQGLTGGAAQEFFAYQILRMRHGQKADNPKIKIPHYFLDEDGKLHKQSEDEEVGFDVVIKLEKTNSCLSLKQNSEIHLPFYYQTGFKPLVPSDEQFVIDGTDEEKLIIRQKLIEKGILQESSFDFLAKKEEDIYSESDGMAIPPSIPVEQKEFTKEETATLDKPKKRGRKAKEQK